MPKFFNGVNKALEEPKNTILGEGANSLNIVEAVSSMKKLSDATIRQLLVPLNSLAGIFKNSVFGDIFNYMMKQLQKAKEEEPTPEELGLFNTPAYEKFLAALEKLPQTAIDQSRAEFDKIQKILKGSEFAKLFDEISSVLNLRNVLFDNLKTALPLFQQAEGMDEIMTEDAAKAAEEIIGEAAEIGGSLSGGLLSELPVGTQATKKNVQYSIKQLTGGAIPTSNLPEVLTGAQKLGARLSTNPVVNVPKIIKLQDELTKIQQIQQPRDSLSSLSSGTTTV